MKIDKTTYNKATRIPYNPDRRCGYQPRPAGRLDIRADIIHTTNGHVGSTLHQEATYIANSLDISAHFLIGKNGEIIQFLDPVLYIAYHAGCVKSTIFSNLFSIGVEMHNTPAEGQCTTAQLNALNWLTLQLIAQFNIKQEYIETHRNVAVFCKGHPREGQLGRKIDPSGLSDRMFYSWRESLYALSATMMFRVKASKVNIRTSPKIALNNIAGELFYGDTFESAAIKHDENDVYIKGVNTWAHVTKGEHNNIPVDGLGFVHMSNLQRIS